MQSTENKQTTHLDVDAIRARADAATEGPWDHLPYDDVTQAMSLAEQTGPHEWQRVGIVPAEHIRNDDAEFIAHARTDVPNLLDALAAERDRADRAEAALASLIPVLEMTQGTAHTLLRGVLIGGVYSAEATPNQNRQKQDMTKWALEQAQANLSQLRRQVADAPHAYSCLSSFAIRGDGCTCWKSEATA